MPQSVSYINLDTLHILSASKDDFVVSEFSLHSVPPLYLMRPNLSQSTFSRSQKEQHLVQKARKCYPYRSDASAKQLGDLLRTAQIYRMISDQQHTQSSTLVCTHTWRVH